LERHRLARRSDECEDAVAHGEGLRCRTGVVNRVDVSAGNYEVGGLWRWHGSLCDQRRRAEQQQSCERSPLRLGLEKLHDSFCQWVVQGDSVQHVAAIADALDDAFLFKANDRLAHCGPADLRFARDARWSVLSSRREHAQHTYCRLCAEYLIQRMRLGSHVIAAPAMSERSDYPQALQSASRDFP